MERVEAINSSGMLLYDAAMASSEQRRRLLQHKQISKKKHKKHLDIFLGK